MENNLMQGIGRFEKSIVRWKKIEKKSWKLEVHCIVLNSAMSIC